jgi:hypothetical protein
VDFRARYPNEVLNSSLAPLASLSLLVRSRDEAYTISLFANPYSQPITDVTEWISVHVAEGTSDTQRD